MNYHQSYYALCVPSCYIHYRLVFLYVSKLFHQTIKSVMPWFKRYYRRLHIRLW